MQQEVKNLPQDIYNLRRPHLHLEKGVSVLLYNLYLISKSLSFLIQILGILIKSPFQTSFDSSMTQHIWSFQHMAATEQCE